MHKEKVIRDRRMYIFSYYLKLVLNVIKYNAFCSFVLIILLLLHAKRHWPSMVNHFRGMKINPNRFICIMNLQTLTLYLIEALLKCATQNASCSPLSNAFDRFFSFTPLCYRTFCSFASKKYDMQKRFVKLDFQ